MKGITIIALLLAFTSTIPICTANNSIILENIRKLVQNPNIGQTLQNLDIDVDGLLERLGKVADIRLSPVGYLKILSCGLYHKKGDVSICGWSPTTAIFKGRPRPGGLEVLADTFLKFYAGFCEIAPLLPISFCGPIELHMNEFDAVHLRNEVRTGHEVVKWFITVYKDGTEMIFPNYEHVFSESADTESIPTPKTSKAVPSSELFFLRDITTSLVLVLAMIIVARESYERGVRNGKQEQYRNMKSQTHGYQKMEDHDRVELPLNEIGNCG